MRRAAGVLAALILLLTAPFAQAETPFRNWAAVVVAGDWHAHSGKPSETFDNARRDVAATLEGFGFQHDAVRQYSVRPRRYPDTRPGRSEMETIHGGLRDLAARNAAGCLFYISSHGAPEGVQLGDDIVPPQLLAAMIDDACPNRPSIVVVSACFSGVFLPPLQRDDRMILTAARADRASFGCGESDKYPYFDDCFLSSAQTARDFIALGRAAQACVRRKEAETGAEPASEPQLWIGPDLRPQLPLYAFPQPRMAPQAAPRAASAKNRR